MSKIDEINTDLDALAEKHGLTPEQLAYIGFILNEEVYAGPCCWMEVDEHNLEIAQSLAQLGILETQPEYTGSTDYITHIVRDE